MKTLPISEARASLLKLVDEVDRTFERVVLTKSGRPKAVLMSSDEFESWQETIEILSDKAAMRAIRQAEKDIAAGDVVPYDDLRRDLLL